MAGKLRVSLTLAIVAGMNAFSLPHATAAEQPWIVFATPVGATEQRLAVASGIELQVPSEIPAIVYVEDKGPAAGFNVEAAIRAVRSEVGTSRPTGLGLAR